MPLNKKQIATLLQLAASSEDDALDCDGCFEHLAQFAELILLQQEIPAALRVVEVHLRQCPCCKDEFEALMEGLRKLES
jgi:hypothetical protein